MGDSATWNHFMQLFGWIIAGMVLGPAAIGFFGLVYLNLCKWLRGPINVIAAVVFGLLGIATLWGIHYCLSFSPS